MSLQGKKDIIIPTTYGPIRGREYTGVYGAQYYLFEGIPFAKPPIGDLRFLAPQAPEPWTEIRDCLEESQKPFQWNIITGEFEGSEDCLYVNVYTKRLKGDKPLPIMVYIYGGAFSTGGASRNDYGADYFMEQEVILITFNYRLGALGFLSLPDPDLQVPGNAGLKDQQAVLRWVQANATNFNGDPNNITLFGNSAGSASVHYHMLSPNAKGLFHKAILQSGTAYNPWAVTPQKDYAFRLAKLKGYTGHNVDDQVLAFLRDLPETSVMGQEVLDDADRLQDVNSSFAPTVEPYFTVDCVIPASPKELQRASWSNDIPVIIGGVTFEGLVLYAKVKRNPNSVQVLRARPELALLHETRKNKSADECKKLGMELLQQHVPPEDNTFLPILDLLSWKSFWLGFQRVILARLAYTLPGTPTYLYCFDFYSDDFNFHRLKYCGSDPIRGISHGDDLSYLFYGKPSWRLFPETDEYKTIQRMIGMWTAFAENSNPNCSAIEPSHWDSVNPVEQFPRCLHISKEVKMATLPVAEKLQAWLNLYDKDELF